MSPFRSAELKDYAERLWALGSDLSARQLSYMFRHGELRYLMQQLAEAITKYDALAALVADLERQERTLDALLNRLIMETESLRTLQATRWAAIEQAERNLAFATAVCEEWRKGIRTDTYAAQACAEAHNLEAYVIPALITEAEDGQKLLEFRETEIRIRTDQLKAIRERLPKARDDLRLYQGLLQDLGI